MKKLLISIFISSILLSACQITPEQEIVKNKNRGLFEDLSRVSAKGPYIVPERLTDSIEGRDGITEFYIDAGIDFPKDKKIPIVEIAPREIDIELVEKMADVFMNGLALYKPLFMQATKDEIENFIIQTYGQIALSDDQQKAENESSYLLKSLKELIKNAPEEKELIEAKIEFSPSKNYEAQYIYMANTYEFSEQENKDSFVQELLDKYENKRQIMLQAFYDTETSMFINAYNYSSKTTNESKIHFYRQSTSDMLMVLSSEESAKLAAINESESITEDENIDAGKIATSVLERLEISNMGITDIEYSNDMAIIIFQPKYSDVQTDDMITDMYGEDYEQMKEIMESAVNPFYKKENIEVKITDGRIISFMWENPSETVRVINGNAALMEFEEIAGIIKTQLPIICNVNQYDDIYMSGDNTAYGSENITGVNISVSEIKFCMVRIAVKNKRGIYNMVPAWKCSGSETVTVKNTRGEMVSTTNEDVEFITVNAIDGSIIDLSLGY